MAGGGIQEDLQRWTAKRCVALVTSILKGEKAALPRYPATL